MYCINVTAPWRSYEYFVDFYIMDIEQPLDMRDLKEWLAAHHDEQSAFDINGRPKQPYISSVSNEHAAYIMRQLLKHDIPAETQELSMEILYEATSKNLTGAALHKKALAAQRRDVPRRVVTTTQFYRDPGIAKYAKERAHGICQLCGQPAPFHDTNGQPYLECHHIIWLSHGGADSVENTVALCPNCHRKMHERNEEDDVELLQHRVSET